MDGPDGALLKANPHTMEKKRGSARSPQPAQWGIPAAHLEEISHDAICRVFGIRIAKHRSAPEYNLAGEYCFDPFVSLKPAN